MKFYTTIINCNCITIIQIEYKLYDSNRFDNETDEVSQIKFNTN